VTHFSSIKDGSSASSSVATTGLGTAHYRVWQPASGRRPLAFLIFYYDSTTFVRCLRILNGLHHQILISMAYPELRSVTPGFIQLTTMNTRTSARKARCVLSQSPGRYTKRQNRFNNMFQNNTTHSLGLYRGHLLFFGITEQRYLDVLETHFTFRGRGGMNFYTFWGNSGILEINLEFGHRISPQTLIFNHR
jgi:hypothetical protein